MPLILGLDVETTGIDPAAERIIEVGAVLWDWDSETPLEMMSRLVRPERPISAEITGITGITDAMVEKHGRSEAEALSELEALISQADFILAHNANFDRSFYLAACARHGVSPSALPWLCSRVDVRYPESIGTRKLAYLAAEHGFISPFGSHRAVLDVLTTQDCQRI